jgi:hypothetical protein
MQSIIAVAWKLLISNCFTCTLFWKSCSGTLYKSGRVNTLGQQVHSSPLWVRSANSQILPEIFQETLPAIIHSVRGDTGSLGIACWSLVLMVLSRSSALLSEYGLVCSKLVQVTQQPAYYFNVHPQLSLKEDSFVN